MSTATVDYDALASQHGGTSAPAVDYDALATQHGGAPVQAAAQSEPAAPASEPGGISAAVKGAYGNSVGPVVDLASQAIQHTAHQYTPQGQAEDQQLEKQQEDFKKQTYTEAGQHLKSGDFKAAAGTLLSLLGGGPTDKSDPVYKLVSGLIDAHKEQAKKTVESAKEGKVSETIGHGLATVLPGLGPAAAQAGEDIGKGQTAKGLGETAGLIGSVFAPRALPKVAEGASTVAKAASEGLDTLRGKGVEVATKGVANAQADVAVSTAKASQAADEAHPKVLSDRFVATLQKTAQREGFELTGTTPREAVPELGSKYQARAKAAYQSVDKAVGGELQPVLDGIDETKMGIKANSAIDPEKAADLRTKLTGLETKKTALIQKAAANGVADADRVIKSADTDYARFKGLEAVGKQIKTASGEVRTGGLPDVKKYASAIDRLNDTGKLQKALPQEAAELKQHGVEALDRSAKAKEATGLSKAAADKLSKAEAGVEKAKTNRYKLVRRGLTGVGIAGTGGAVLSKVLGDKD